MAFRQHPLATGAQSRPRTDSPGPTHHHRSEYTHVSVTAPTAQGPVHVAAEQCPEAAERLHAEVSA